MYLLPIYLCFFSFMVSFLFGHVCSSKGSIFLNIISLFFSLLLSFFIFYEVCFLHINCYIHLMPWMSLGNISIYWSFLFDTISCVMLIVILFVSFCANFYSIEYMLYDPHKVRFFSYLSLFTFTMIMLVTANNIIQLFFGWECVGLSSYLLINFWYTRLQANKSSVLAIMANKTGDILLLFSCLHLLFICNSVYFNTVFLYCESTLNYTVDLYNNIINYNITGYLLVYKENLVYFLFSNNIVVNINDYINYNIIFFTSTFVCFFIIIASICKSAQSGFHFWLAEAMEGPTPVSSLLHAATMVTAGIFLTVRCSFLFTYSNNIPIFIIFIGSITGFFSSIIGFTQHDLKKIVAYSTCSQLGFMFLSNGIFSYNYTMFHLFNHAFFKALLFLTSGYIIHIMSNEQDLRKIGGMIKIIPLPYICLLIGSISLMGVPYLSGFFSKDVIVESFYSIIIGNNINMKYYSVIFFSQILIAISCIFTILYSIKLIFYTFIGTYNGFYSYILNIHFSSVFITLPLILLSLLSICSGFFFNDMMIGTSTLFWKNSLNVFLYSYKQIIPSLFNESNIVNFFLLPYEFNKFTYYSLLINTVYISFFGFIIFYYYSFLMYFYSFGIVRFYNLIIIHVNSKILFFNRLWINNILSFFFMESYKSTYQLMDKNIFEIIGPFGVVFHIKYILNYIGYLQTGLIYHYSGIMIIFLIYFSFLLNFSYFFI